MRPTLKNILLIEDDPAHAEIFTFYAGRIFEDVTVEHLADGEAALTYFEELTLPGPRLPEIIFLDLNLPRYSGVEVLTRIRQNPLACRIPAVVFTSSESERDIHLSWKLGASSYLRKPMEENGFEPLIRNALSYWAGNERDRTLYERA